MEKTGRSVFLDPGDLQAEILLRGTEPSPSCSPTGAGVASLVPSLSQESKEPAARPHSCTAGIFNLFRLMAHGT